MNAVAVVTFWPTEGTRISTADRTILGSISKRGNRYLRSLFVQACRAAAFQPGLQRRDSTKAIGNDIGQSTNPHCATRQLIAPLLADLDLSEDEALANVLRHHIPNALRIESLPCDT